MKIKNVAIIAHVDHGKTTLVNKLIESSMTDKHQKLDDRILDSNELEKERGITILAKNTAIKYNDYKINILDTPGHADFGGEVERIMHMVDGVLLVVDAFESVMPQTRFVLSKALEKNIKPIVIINKVDRNLADPKRVLVEVYDLFIELGAEIEDLEFPVIYGSALKGIMGYSANEINSDVSIIFDTIIKHIDAPKVNDGPFLFQPSLIDYNDFVGRMGIGKIYQGSVKVGEEVVAINPDGTKEPFRDLIIYQNQVIETIEVKEALAGDIVSIAGLSDINVGASVNAKGYNTTLPAIEIGNPTVEINFQANNSPFVGRDGSNVTSTKIYNRLKYEANKDVSLKVTKKEGEDTWIVAGRGELHLSVLIENMRREGYEFQVSKPEVLYKTVNGAKNEPIEKVTVDVSTEYVGAVIDKLGQRKGELVSMSESTGGYARLEFIIPSRGLIGYRQEFLTDTKGNGILNAIFEGYAPFKGEIPRRKSGSIIAFETGEATTYGLYSAQERGVLFISPGTQVYEGMIVGSNPKGLDIEVNISRKKQQSNVRASGSDDALRLSTPKNMSLEEALEFIEDDELIEITPLNIRVRKRILDANRRYKSKK